MTMSESTTSAEQATQQSSQPRVEKLADRLDALEAENESLRKENEQLREQVAELADTVGFLENYVLDTIDEALFADVGETQAMKLVEEHGDLFTQALTLREQSVEQPVDERSIDRTKLYPAHKMWLDLQAGDGTLSAQEARAARLFAAFFLRAGDGSVPEDEESRPMTKPSLVDPSGQKYTLSSGQARELLREAGAFDGVSKDSEVVITGRVMRAVQRFTKMDDCECEDIDVCEHGLIQLKTGGTNVLHVNKKRFHAAMQFALESLQGADDASPTGVEADTGRDDTADVDGEVEAELDQLTDPDNNVVSRSEGTVLGDGGRNTEVDSPE